jgi:predicted amidohydrolase YtcJ
MIDTLLVGGVVLTMDPTHPEAEAVAVAGGRVVAVGASADLLARRDRHTAVIDLGGRFVCPGFVDPHNHFAMTALAPIEVDCRTPPLRSIAAIVERIHAAAAALPPGTWLRGHGYDEEALRERRHPTRAELDEAAPDHPVVLVHWSVHRCTLNSAALAVLGIDAATPDPPGGWIVRDVDGHPAGPLYETATNPAQSRSLTAYAERYAARAPALIESNARRYLAAGITAVGDAYVSPALSGLYEAAVLAGRLPIGVSAYCGSAAGLFASPTDCLPAPPSLTSQEDGPWSADRGPLRRAGIKLFVDGGGNTTATSLTGDHAHRAAGRLFYSQAELDELVAAAHARGMQVAIHAAGDIAVRMAVTAMERARAAYPALDARFRIEHGVLLSDELIGRIAAVGATLVVQPLSVYYHAERLAAAPLATGLRQLPLRTLLEAGVPVAASSDAPCYPMSPLLSVWAAVTRQTAGGGVHAPEQCLTVAEALRLVTRDAACALGINDREGSLAPGMAADLVVLSADPRIVAPEDIPRIRVIEAYHEGRRIVVDAPDHGVVGRLPPEIMP